MSHEPRQTYTRAREETKRLERTQTMNDLENVVTRLVGTVATLHAGIYGEKGLIAQIDTARAHCRQLDARLKKVEAKLSRL